MASSLQLQGEFNAFPYRLAATAGSLKRNMRLLLLFNAFNMSADSTGKAVSSQADFMTRSVKKKRRPFWSPISLSTVSVSVDQ